MRTKKSFPFRIKSLLILHNYTPILGLWDFCKGQILGLAQKDPFIKNVLVACSSELSTFEDSVLSCLFPHSQTASHYDELQSRITNTNLIRNRVWFQSKDIFNRVNKSYLAQFQQLNHINDDVIIWKCQFSIDQETFL